MSNLIILIDMDNVIADQVDGFYRILADEYPEIILPPRESLSHFDIELNFPEEHRELIRSLRLRKDFFLTLAPISGAKESLNRLSDAGHAIRIVTAPTWEWTHCVAEKYAWVERHLGRSWCEKIILTRDKTMIKGDVLIDDAPRIDGVFEPSWQHVVYDQPYNRTHPIPHRVTWESLGLFLESFNIN